MKLLSIKNVNLSSNPKGLIFLQLANKLLVRDFDDLSTYQSLLSARVLAHFDGLSTDLIVKLFCPEFLDRMDIEMKERLSRNNRNQRKRLMEMNRIVCILHPHFQVPWFHEKYCLEQEKRTPKTKEYMVVAQSVFDTISTVVGGCKFIKDNPTTDKYHIYFDFELWKHKETGEFYPIGDDLERRRIDLNPSDYDRIAILIAPIRYEYPRGIHGGVMHGFGDFLFMDTRLLEGLGYKVICLDSDRWRHLSMASQEAKIGLISSMLLDDKGIVQQNRNGIH